MKTKGETPQTLLETLTMSHAHIRELVADLDVDQLAKPPKAGEWSVNENIAHLAAWNESCGFEIRGIVENPDSRFTISYDYEFVKAPPFRTEDFESLMRRLETGRQSLLPLLQPLAAEQWETSATINGKPRTVFELVFVMARHERTHWAQIKKTARQVQKIN